MYGPLNVKFERQILDFGFVLS